MAKRRKKKKLNKVLLFILLILIIVYGLYYFGIIKKDLPIPKKDKVKIVNINSTTRPYAVMIDNVDGARPHSGLDKAYITYEIIVEGGLTRLMAIFKDVNVNEIGPIRSARHYFIDYVLENDAFFIHHGHSPQALEAIKSYKIDNIEGLYNPKDIFWRDTSRSAPHNSYTNTDGIEKVIDEKNYNKNSDKWVLLNYSVDSIKLDKLEDAIKADKVVINFSQSVNTSFEYDKKKKRYLRYENGEPHMDKKEFQYTTKNIIVIRGIKNFSIDSSNRQEINNIGEGEGYYITNGYAIPIRWEKNNKESKTTYKYYDGTELKINDGNTYIELQPLNQNINITGVEETSSNV